MDFTRALVNRPWAVTAERFRAMLEMARHMTPAASAEPSAALAQRRAALTAENRTGSPRIAVLSLFGLLAQRMNPMDFGGDTSLEVFGAVFKQALAAPYIESIVIEVDSPGGCVFGVEELAAMIFAARGKKRIVAIANTAAAAAAYWIGSAASELSCAPSGQVGSIGIVAVHEDWSRAEDAAGVGVTLISAGKYKTEGNEHEPLSDAARAALQDRVGKYYGMFVRAVATQRGVGQADVIEGFGEGRVVGAADALKLGMVDGVETMDELLTRLATTPATAPTTRAAAGDDPGAEERRVARLRTRDALRRVGQ